MYNVGMDEFRKRILGFLARGESVQIVAPHGFGKSRLGRSLGGLLLDTNLLQTPQELMKAVKSSPEKKLIVIDYLDHILTPEYTPLFKYLKALRDQHKYQLAFVFLTSRPITHNYQPIMGDLYEIATEHVEQPPALTPSEYEMFGFSPTPKQLKEIEGLSGGIPSLVKICVISMRDGTSLDPTENLKLKGQIEEMLAASPNHPVYAKAGLMQKYLSHIPSELTAAETRLLELLKSKSGQIVSKDEIAQAVYPDVKNYSGVSDHALDQLIHRLRSKVKDKYTLSTHRGLGYKLASV